MSAEIIQGVHPTRMELLALKRRKSIAERGRELLREKLDALMMEFFGFVREIQALRSRAQDLLAEAYRDFAEAQMILGYRRLEQVSIGVEDRFDVEATARSVIGVSIPYLHVKVRAVDGAPYSLYDTSAKLDEAVAGMAEAVKTIARLSAAEAAVRKLAAAIASTRRRVNSLEYIVIPRLTNTIRYIEMHLQEREREDFFRLKRIKRRLEAERTIAIEVAH